ncbi:MAG: NlpC/P60 family protein [Clostridia bacterium]
MRKSFLEYLDDAVGNIYVWGGQGQTDISEAWIKRMETSANNADRAIRFWHKRQSEGAKNLAAYDCSGLIVKYLLDSNIEAAGWDTSANGLMNKAQKIGYAALKAGDLLFRVSSGTAYHVGVYIGNGTVIHAKGRDFGVVKEGIAFNGSDYWTDYGILDKLKEAINMPKKLTITSPLMRGNDIKALQTALNALLYDCGTPDGICGNKTIKAISEFCAEQGSGATPDKLNVSVTCGEKTYKGELQI